MVPSLAWGSKINALFLISWIVAMGVSLGTGTTYKEIQNGIIENCSKAIVPAMIILCVGALVGTWNASGTVPVIISFGVRSVSPNMFLMTAFILCAVTALITGTSWGTFGTAGLALAGIGISLNINPVITAGACCGGAFLAIRFLRYRTARTWRLRYLGWISLKGSSIRQRLQFLQP